VDGWMRGIGGRWAEREGQREYRFSSLMKLKKKRKNTLSFTSPEKEIFFCIDDVSTWGKKKALLITTGVTVLVKPLISF